MHINRREFVSLAAAAGLSPLAHAEAPYPNKPITLVVPFTPGGSVDNSGRLMADRLSRLLGVPVIVDNKGGAGGSLGSAFVAKAKPDGYTLIVTSQSTHVVNPAVTPKLPYDAVNDFAPVTLIDRLSNVLLVNASLPVRSFADLVKYAQANPGKLNYASAGTGSVSHLSMELLKTQAKIDITHVPYRGAGVAITDVMSGQVQLAWNNLSTNLASIKNGKLRALAVAAPQRVAQLPDVPTFAELKLPDLNLTSWTGIAAPAKTPQPIIDRLYQAMRTVLQDPATHTVWADKGMMVPEELKPQAYRAEIIERIKFYSRIAKANNIVLE
ncbi:MAG: tripartite tricarboxylate transporter substrate binding protein [Comamonas sp.]